MTEHQDDTSDEETDLDTTDAEGSTDDDDGDDTEGHRQALHEVGISFDDPHERRPGLGEEIAILDRRE